MTYRIKDKCWGSFGRTSYAFEPGEVEPEDAREDEILCHLVDIGRAERVEAVKAVKPKKET